MCLDVVNERFTTNRMTGFGWKTFRVKEDKIESLHYGKKTKITLRKWLVSTDGPARCYYTGTVAQPRYETGFHIWKKRKDARRDLRVMRVHHPDEKLTVRKVEYKNVTTLGHQLCEKVIVAKKMFVTSTRG